MVDKDQWEFSFMLLDGCLHLSSEEGWYRPWRSLGYCWTIMHVYRGIANVSRSGCLIFWCIISYRLIVKPRKCNVKNVRGSTASSYDPIILNYIAPRDLLLSIQHFLRYMLMLLRVFIGLVQPENPNRTGFFCMFGLNPNQTN